MAKRKTKKNPGPDYGSLLMWSAIIVNAPRWAGAFIAADAHMIPEWVDYTLQVASFISGVGMGLIEVLGTAYLLNEWGKMKRKKTWNAKQSDPRWIILTIFVAGLFILMPLILAPYMVTRMNGKTLADTIGPVWQYVWAVATVMAPAFIVGGTAVARDGLIGVSSTEVSPVSEEKQEKPDKYAPKLAKETPATPPNFDELTENAQQVYTLLRANPKGSNTAIAGEVGVSRQYVGQLRTEFEPYLNGAAK